MDRATRDQATIDNEATEWLVRRTDPLRAPEDDDAFCTWLETDPRHGETYDALSRTWQDLGALNGLREHVRAPARTPSRPSTSWSRLQRFTATLAGLAAAMTLVAISPALLDRPDAEFQTTVGDIRALRLPDGSTVTLGGQTRLEWDFSAVERHLKLAGGQAFFEVAHDAARPFLVTAGDARIRAVGTKFDVRRGSEQVQVAVLEGIVEVRNAWLGPIAIGTPRLLRAGERADITEDALLSFAPAVPLAVVADPATAGAWRLGRLAYVDARLVDLVADVNRYYAPGVQLSSSDAGQLRVTTSFRIDEIPTFLDALDTALPVRVERQADGAFHIDARPDRRSPQQR